MINKRRLITDIMATTGIGAIMLVCIYIFLCQLAERLG